MVSYNVSATCIAAVTVLFTLAPVQALAHCDALDGPVVKAAQRALETRSAAPALIWVQAGDEQEIRTVFAQTLAVRDLNPQAKALADRFFFETLVRVHRAGEGAAFTGLKPAGTGAGPAITAADDAIRVGSLDPLLRLVTETVQERLREHFAETMATKTFGSEDVTAGRAHVKAYVEYLHFVEHLYEMAKTPTDHR